MTRARVVGAGAALALGLVAGACGGGGTDAAAPTTTQAAPTTSTTTLPEPQLPPASASELEPTYRAELAALGLRLTDRGGLIDRSGGGYVPSATGDHLALYVEPIAERTADEYVEGIRSVAVVFSDVFERWPGLASYDVCQEPVDDDEEPGREPLPVTQIELTRAEAAAIDWATVTVLDLVQSSQAEPPGLALRVGTGLRKNPAYEAMLEEAS